MLNRVVRIVAGLALFMVVTVGGAALWSWDVTEVVDERVIPELAARDVNLELERVRFSPVRGIRVSELSVSATPGNGRLAVEAGSTRISLRFWDLARGVPAPHVVDSIAISGASAVWSRAGDVDPRIDVAGLALNMAGITLGEGPGPVGSGAGAFGDPAALAPVGLARVRASGDFQAERVRARDALASHVSGDIEIDDGRVRVVDARFLLEGTEYDLEGLVDFGSTPFTYEVQVVGESVDLDALVAVFQRERAEDGASAGEPGVQESAESAQKAESDPDAGENDDPAAGFGPGRLDYAGSGIGPGFGGIEGEGVLALDSGSLGAVPLGGAMDAIVGAILDGIGYEPAEVRFHNRGPVFEIEPTTLITDRAEISIAGSIDLEGEIDLRGDVLLPDTGFGFLLRMLPGDPEALRAERAGWLSVPYRVIGPRRQPRVVLDSDVLQARSDAGS